MASGGIAATSEAPDQFTLSVPIASTNPINGTAKSSQSPSKRRDCARSASEEVLSLGKAREEGSHPQGKRVTERTPLVHSDRFGDFAFVQKIPKKCLIFQQIPTLSFFFLKISNDFQQNPTKANLNPVNQYFPTLEFFSNNFQRFFL